MKTYSVYSGFLDRSFIVVTEGDPSEEIIKNQLQIDQSDFDMINSLEIQELSPGIHEERDVF